MFGVNKLVLTEGGDLAYVTHECRRGRTLFIQGDSVDPSANELHKLHVQYDSTHSKKVYSVSITHLNSHKVKTTTCYYLSNFTIPINFLIINTNIHIE